MAKPQRVRWQCPEDKHTGELGLSRPPADATVRYCLECSKETGRLVKRVAPALERKREERAQRRRAVKERSYEREKERARARNVVRVVDADGSRSELDVGATIKAMRRLPELAAYRPSSEPDVVLRRRGDGEASGRAWPGFRIMLSIGLDCPREKVEELILHELVHYLLPGGANHGPRYRSTLLRAAREWWPGAVDGILNEGKVYGMDARIWKAAREANNAALT